MREIFDGKKKTVVFEGLVDGMMYCKKKGVELSNVVVYDKENCICFSSRLKDERSKVMTNMYMCELPYKGLVFNSLEQAFHYFCFEDNRELCEMIMRCKSSFGVKKLCKWKKVNKNKDVWKILEKCMELKYEYCEEFRKILDESGDKDLVEYASWGDVEYGCSLMVKDGKEFLMGMNGCGKTMMKVREKMRKKKSEAA